jgi:hypothetical protein
LNDSPSELRRCGMIAMRLIESGDRYGVDHTLATKPRQTSRGRLEPRLTRRGRFRIRPAKKHRRSTAIARQTPQRRAGFGLTLGDQTRA